MSLSVSFRRSARAEFIEAAAWYESELQNLGVEFIAEIERCVTAAADQPLIYSAVYKDVAASSRSDSRLACTSARKLTVSQVLYTADMRALENDEIFVDFITGNHDAFVIEDADHLLKARSRGNVDLHRFLAVADGVVRAQGRKIVFTTNLPNIGDIDEALVRPGRCFATVRTRALERREAASLLVRIAAARMERNEPASAVALPAEVRSITLAALYRLVNAEG